MPAAAVLPVSRTRKAVIDKYRRKDFGNLGVTLVNSWTNSRPTVGREAADREVRVAWRAFALVAEAVTSVRRLTICQLQEAHPAIRFAHNFLLASIF